MSKLIFLLPLALCLTFQPYHIVATGGAIEKAAAHALIQTACAATSSPPICFTTLSALADNPYLNPIDITITAVQASTKMAVATFDLINMSLTIKTQIVSDPQFRQSLVICAKEYKNVIDLLDKTSTSLTQQGDAPQVPEYLSSAIGCVAKCDASGVKFANKLVQVSAKNVDTTKLIKNALAIYKVFADYIVNPSHNPSKGPTPTADVSMVGSATTSTGGDDKGSDSSATVKASGTASGGTTSTGGDDKGSDKASGTASGGDQQLGGKIFGSMSGSLDGSAN